MEQKLSKSLLSNITGGRPGAAFAGAALAAALLFQAPAPALGAPPIQNRMGERVPLKVMPPATRPTLYNAAPAQQGLMGYIDGLPRMAIKSSRATPIPFFPLDGSLSGLRDAGYTAKGQEVELYNNNRELTAYDPLPVSIWPGAVIQGASIHSNQFTGVNLGRSGGTITVRGNFVGNSNVPKYRDLPLVTSGKVDEAREQVLAEINATDAAGNIRFDMATGRSEKDLAVKLGILYKDPQVDVDASANYTQNIEQSMVMAKYYQVFYTVTFDPPTDNDQNPFAPNVSVSDLQKYSSPSNPPLYVSEVKYGRMILVAFKAKTDRATLEAAVKGTYNAGTQKISGSLDAKLKEVLEGATISYQEIGTTGETSMGVLQKYGTESVLSALARTVNNGLKYSRSNPGAPVMFKLRYIGKGPTSRGEEAVAQLSAGYIEITELNPPAPQCVNGIQVWDGFGGGWTYVNLPAPVRPGDAVQINADQNSKNWSGVFGTGDYGPTGWYTWAKPSEPGFPIMNKSPFALIGRLGDEDRSGNDPAYPQDNGSPQCDGRTAANCSSSFYVGNSRTVTAGEAVNIREGNLYLGTNDNNPTNGDYNKKFRVNVCVKRKNYGNMATF